MLAMSGVEPRDEHDIRIWTPIAMWLAGACTIGIGTILPDGGELHIEQLRGVVALAMCAALFTFVVFRPLSNRALYVMTNIFSALGSLTVWFACLWSGGASSGFLELYFLVVGIGLLLSSLFVFYRDLGHVWEISLQLLFYGSAIVFPFTLIPQRFRMLLGFNPMAQIIEDMRRSIVTSAIPWSGQILGRWTFVPVLVVVAVMCFGFCIFRRLSPKFGEAI